MNYLVLGLPKSGTSALFQSLTKQCPKHAWSFERVQYVTDEQFANGVICKEVLENRRSIAYKKEHYRRFDRIVFIVRDPRDRLVSAMLYVCFNLITKKEDPRIHLLLDAVKLKEAEPFKVSCQDILDTLGQKLLGIQTMGSDEHLVYMINDIVELGKEFRLVRYEDVFAGDVARLDEFLGFKINQPMNSQGGMLTRVGRRRTPDDWRNWLLPSDIDAVRAVFDPLIWQFSYDTDWTLSDRPELPPETGSEFIKARITERTGYRFPKDEINWSI